VYVACVRRGGSGGHSPIAVALALGLLVAVGSALPSGAVSANTTTTTKPVDYPSALVARLAKEYGDPVLARKVVVGLDPGLLSQLEARVPLPEVARSPFLSYRPKRVAAGSVESVVVFAFGNRVGADGSLEPGPTNEKLAVATKRFVRRNPVPVFAQQEIAELLEAAGVKHVTSIDPIVGPDGKLVYLSTAGVAEQVLAKAHAAGVDLGTVGVIGFADHVVRCVLTAKAAGMTTAVPKGVVLPRTYDPESSQPWTRDRASYLATDLVGRLASL